MVGKKPFSGAVSDLWLLTKHDHDCYSHFQNKHLVVLLRSVWRWALPGPYSPHFYIMQFKGKKKSTTSHTLFWVLFFPFLGWNVAGICPLAFLTEPGDRITHIQKTHTVKLSASHSRAFCCQLTAIFFPRVHLPIKGDWNKQLRFTTLSYLVVWNLFHLTTTTPPPSGDVSCVMVFNASS